MANEYKIGDFSKHMGVTPDFLKHYESYNLLSPSKKESGYRYYRFEMASEVLECIRYRNWEFSIKEIQQMVQNSNLEQIRSHYKAKVTELTEMVQFYQLLIGEYQQFENWLDDENNNWSIQTIEPMVFLPHTDNKDFIQDARLDKIMEQWMQWMPMVHSCQHIDQAFDGTPAFHWGFSVKKSIADQMGLISSSPCEIIPASKCLILNLKRVVKSTDKGHLAGIEEINKIIEAHNLKARGDIYKEVYQFSNEEEGKTQYCSLIVPLK